MPANLSENIDAIELDEIQIGKWVDKYLFWPDRRSVSEWVEDEVILPPKVTSFPGPVSLSMTPYQRPILNAFGMPHIEQITERKSTQTAGTQGMIFMLGYAIDVDPGPCMFIMPKAEAARQISSERVRPMMDVTPALSKHFRRGSYDTTTTRYIMDRCNVWFGSAGSPTDLSSKAVRFAFADEIDKWAISLDDEASPLDLLRERMRWQRNSKLVIASTPTLTGSLIDREYEASDKRQYFFPCPHCNHYQLFKFPQLKWPKGEKNHSRIRSRRLAWYECDDCGERIEEADKEGCVASGVWCPEACTINPDGTLKGPQDSPHYGVWINCFMSPRLTFSDIAGEFVRCDTTTNPGARRAALQNFTNSWLAENWAEVITGHGIYINPTDKYEFGVVPEGTLLLTAGVDVQGEGEKGYVYYVIRAWLSDEESVLIEEGMIGAPVGCRFKELHMCLFGVDWEDNNHKKYKVELVCIDSGHRTAEVYAYAKRYPLRVYAIKGASVVKPETPISHMRPTKGKGKKKARRSDLKYWSLNTGFLKDMIAASISTSKWHVPKGVSDTYIKQCEAEHKIEKTDANGFVVAGVWAKKPGHKANHELDCEVYAMAAADIKGYFDGAYVPQPKQAAKPPKASTEKEWMDGY